MPNSPITTAPLALLFPHDSNAPPRHGRRAARSSLAWRTRPRTGSGPRSGPGPPQAQGRGGGRISIPQQEEVGPAAAPLTRLYAGSLHGICAAGPGERAVQDSISPGRKRLGLRSWSTQTRGGSEGSDIEVYDPRTGKPLKFQYLPCEGADNTSSMRRCRYRFLKAGSAACLSIKPTRIRGPI